MSDQMKNALLEYTTRLGDDAVVLGHRISEWVSYGPFLEEDIAYGNVALDYIGRARMFYTYAAELADDGRDEDDFAYMRNDREYHNLLLLELPKGDFAYSQVRQLFADVYYTLMLPQLLQSKDERLAAIAAKAIKETKYHLRRSRDWVLRLGEGTDESHRRAQKALDQLWGYTHELFDMDETEQLLADADIGVDVSKLRDDWLAMVTEIVTNATLSVPEDSWAVRGGRIGYHTENLGHMLTEMQIVHRSHPGCKW
ncbi:1,2-phenylacetyl-CoA epoxidase subunit PaaC [Amphritea sp. 2_MG-2023]|uniref:1,2-phenylacetyl-CoA epoxidase subunit PaaC n=1 Tax=Amphritea TaxID=515417 RepID=UPI001C07175A|nr:MULTISPECIES: 1,2-phenylacetyl-CoA epoxidase subunit PaaC [Amphritea]MBU2965296.1 phenylacetate-CoA oxygenase subunit PaaC [Amphritea atlantica]MDO6420159.1 1,2-phenylacetyl-CoA epoxidase subunit PaaC [Amphritea sp. 2_MG-2023]